MENSESTIVDPRRGLLESARVALRSNRAAEAEAVFEDLANRPVQDGITREALESIALLNLGRRDFSRAEIYLEKAIRLDPSSAPLHTHLGVMLEHSGRLEEAAAALRRAVAAEPAAHLAHLHLGKVEERLGDRYSALGSYFRALAHAQMQGLWTSPENVPSGLHRDVGNAMDFVSHFQARLAFEMLSELKADHGEKALDRFQRAVEMFLRQIATEYPDPRQKPRFFFFPDLPTQTFFERKQLLPWCQALEANTDVIREEFETISTTRRLDPFLSLGAEARVADYVTGPKGISSWSGFFFYRHGERFAKNGQECPRTAALLEGAPLARVGRNAPEALFSVLSPQSHIAPHRGATNTRTVVHLPLVVPRECRLVVGGEVREWKPGECMAFDDTFEHEAWNRSDAPRTVLILDVWNPYLTESERDAVARLIPHFTRVEAALKL